MRAVLSTIWTLAATSFLLLTLLVQSVTASDTKLPDDQQFFVQLQVGTDSISLPLENDSNQQEVFGNDYTLEDAKLIEKVEQDFGFTQKDHTSKATNQNLRVSLCPSTSSSKNCLSTVSILLPFFESAKQSKSTLPIYFLNIKVSALDYNRPWHVSAELAARPLLHDHSEKMGKLIESVVLSLKRRNALFQPSSEMIKRITEDTFLRTSNIPADDLAKLKNRARFESKMEETGNEDGKINLRNTPPLLKIPQQTLQVGYALLRIIDVKWELPQKSDPFLVHESDLSDAQKQFYFGEKPPAKKPTWIKYGIFAVPVLFILLMSG